MKSTTMYVPPAARPEYEDLHPLAQTIAQEETGANDETNGADETGANDETNRRCCKIAYDPLFKELHDYFWALCRGKKEYTTKRALEMTEEVIKANAGNYTAW